MNRIILILTSLLLLSCSGHPRQESLTLISYNIGAFSKYQDNSIPGVAGLILDNSADFVGLNELDSCNRRHDTFQLQALAEELGGWQYHFASAFPYAGGGYGNGVVTARPVTARYSIPLPKGDGAEARSVAVVETDVCVFAAVHLDHKGQTAALEQMKVVNQWFEKVYGGARKPVFLCGDFNVTPDSEVIAEAETCWTLLSGENFTYSTTHPKSCIDYIFALRDAAQVEVTGYEVLTEGTAELSDHFPVKITVRTWPRSGRRSSLPGIATPKPRE